jgi:hypothetical protein
MTSSRSGPVPDRTGYRKAAPVRGALSISELILIVTVHPDHRQESALINPQSTLYIKGAWRRTSRTIL